ncbi:hypothetical protein KBD61_04460 [Patescibacteria group bacterium]|nr:hypothetical protein [Patescibacteria group bacterium]MBP9710247.1 hypothetical protein [Patescibacteria group bacterium]
MPQEIKKHSDENFIKGFQLYLLFKRIAESNANTLDIEGFDLNDEIFAWKILQLFSLTVAIEQALLCVLDQEYMKLNEEQRSSIKKHVLGKIRNKHKLKTEGESQALLEKQTSTEGHIIIPPVIQYLAGYTLGDIVALTDRSFPTVPKELIESLGRFKEERNYIMHNSISSRDSFEKRITNGINSGKTILSQLEERLDTSPFI